MAELSTELLSLIDAKMRAGILLEAAEARIVVGSGEKNFPSLGIPPTKVGKRRKYHPDDLRAWINSHREQEKCRSAKGEARRSTGMTSRSRVLDFEEVLKQTTRP